MTDTINSKGVHKPECKLGGSHTTIIGGRAGKKIVSMLSQHPSVKKVIPSVIAVKGKGNSGGKLTAKIQRPDDRGNLRLLLSHGTSFQELRIVTNVGSFEEGEDIMKELNSLLSDI
ncbi:DUF2103 domain-containing protein [Methanolobus sediminis]|uniref:DUF2103 domain-containing protein n=1 Tax=Methanolobus sediminis TaxID=3072978 RepID=A0AA51UJ72_9EURY|nr:DUF2103 domain-containing protein [Methanolobus sediminis]WMW24578.1 DUF2103 domain-containing protein [Methanolobus sediminis]